jgi:hypothetical protein
MRLPQVLFWKIKKNVFRSFCFWGKNYTMIFGFSGLVFAVSSLIVGGGEGGRSSIVRGGIGR